MMENGEALGPFIGIMAKAPRPGHAKTRLARALPAEVAADLYRHFLLDTVEVTRHVPGAVVGLVCPPGDGEELRALGLEAAIVEQPEPGLMQGLAFGIDRALAAGHRAAALINADSPTLPADRLVAAFALLDDADVVLGPSADGGYYLIGARVSCARLLLDAPYPSSATICADTLARAWDLGLRTGTIPPWFDVDLPSELRQLVLSLRDAPAHAAVHTRRALAAHAPAIAALLAERHDLTTRP
jgi:rSAM/selenodomain-associated transferase 1